MKTEEKKIPIYKISDPVFSVMASGHTSSITILGDSKFGGYSTFEPMDIVSAFSYCLKLLKTDGKETVVDGFRMINYYTSILIVNENQETILVIK